jgi:hypothetical protein
LSGALEAARPKIIEAVLPILKSDRENDRFVAAQILGEYGPPARAAVPDLLALQRYKSRSHLRNREMKMPR